MSSMNMQDKNFCQSCGMPMTDPSLYGREKDGSPNAHYCKYCYENGAFTDQMSMEEMIEFCVPITVKAVPGLSEETAREQMRQFFPQLLRWKEAKQ